MVQCPVSSVQCPIDFTAWKVSKYGVFSGPYFPAFGLNTDQEKLLIWTLFTQCFLQYLPMGFIRWQNPAQSFMESFIYRSSHPEVFLGKGILKIWSKFTGEDSCRSEISIKLLLKICSKFTGEHSCQSAISIKLLYNFIEVILWQRCSPVNMLHISRTSFHKNTSVKLLLTF